ncbi:MAG: hypothetical protein EHM20_10075 [Alphaproteobacteria bacterium]|nr:MAG: hypothetical protein EHM20_10075 [Alphaproteobacteria bacterium]
MIILVIGTIVQKDIGLYQAQMKYFSSWFFWLGPIPVPSAKPILGLILILLIIQFLFKTNFLNFKKMGISIAHLGSLLLLLGGVITNHYSEEGSMIIPEGETTNYIQDYHRLELSITEADTEALPIIIEESKIKSNVLISDSKLPFTLRLVDFYSNSKFITRENATENKDYIGFANRFKVIEEPRNLEDSDNQSALNFEITTDSMIEKYSIVQNMPVIQSISKNGKTYKIELRNKRTYLPFSIQLIDFEKTFHPSSSLPKSFKSTIYMIDGEIKQRNIIKMNEPFRYKDYTFFQSSFSEGQEGETTNLAVVKNYGRIFPYISSIIICLGLLLHLFINSSQLFKKYNKARQL